MAAKRKAAPPRTPRTPKKRARAKPKAKADWAPAFLAAFSETHLVSEACKRAGVGRSTVYERRSVDESFAADWTEVEERSTEILEQIAVRRAADGSDVLLIFLLKARRPDVYRENVRHEHSGPEGGPIAAETTIVDKRKRSDAARKYLAAIAGD